MAGVELGGTFGNRVVMDPAALAQLLRGENGPVFRQTSKAAEIVKAGAQKRVGVWSPSPGEPDWSVRRRLAKRRPGTLRDSIVKRVVTDPEQGFAILVGTEDEIALFHHEGTRPHTITATNAPLLVFWSARARTVLRTESVQHPGTKPNRFLMDALADLAGLF